MWAVAFGAHGGPVAAKAAVPFGAARTSFDAGGLGVTIDGCTLSARAARGRVETGDRAVSYDLAIEPLAEPLLLYPSAWMYSGRWPVQKITSPLPTGRVSGRVQVGAETWEIARWPAMVGHNWGRRHAPLYAWGHCNAWDGDEDFVLEGASIGGGGPVSGDPSFAFASRACATIPQRRALARPQRRRDHPPAVAVPRAGRARRD